MARRYYNHRNEAAKLVSQGLGVSKTRLATLKFKTITAALSLLVSFSAEAAVTPAEARASRRKALIRLVAELQTSADPKATIRESVDSILGQRALEIIEARFAQDGIETVGDKTVAALKRARTT